MVTVQMASGVARFYLRVLNCIFCGSAKPRGRLAPCCDPTSSPFPQPNPSPPPPSPGKPETKLCSKSSPDQVVNPAVEGTRSVQRKEEGGEEGGMCSRREGTS